MSDGKKPLPEDDPRSQDAQARLDAVRRHRVYPTPDRSLGFLADAFKKDIEKPYKQFINLLPAWESLIPAELQERTRLDRLSRGTLHVVVEGSANLYELDRLLRGGLANEIIRQQRGSGVRRIKLELGVVRNLS